MLRTFAVICALCVFPALALAEQTPDECEGQEQCTEIPFDDGDQITGDIQRPDGSIYSAQGRVRHTSLVQVRTHFVPELLQSVEEL